MVYVPEGCVHGFQTREDHSEVTYQVSHSYTPAAERGVHYDDPAFGIRWPLAVSLISDKDRRWPRYATEPCASRAKRLVRRGQ